MLALRVGASLNILIGLLHLAALFWLRQLADWIGIGEQMDRLTALHARLPYIVTIVTAGVFGMLGVYGFSASGRVRPLPFVKPVIVIVAMLFSLRAVGGLVLAVLGKGVVFNELILSFIALTIGTLYAIGAHALLKKGKRVVE